MSGLGFLALNGSRQNHSPSKCMVAMAENDFTIESLAAYMHVDPAKIDKLASRGKIPSRKVGGQWRFSGAEIHHWLEEKIGVSDDEALEEMEEVLDRELDVIESQHLETLAEMLPVEAIALPLRGKTKSAVITAMVATAEQTGWLWDPDKLAEAIRNREELHPTALEGGVALLHPRRPMPSILGHAFVALGITPSGVPFGGGRGMLTDVFFLICSTDDRGHLRTLARLSRVINDEDFMHGLRSCETAAAAHDLIVQRETALAE